MNIWIWYFLLIHTDRATLNCSENPKMPVLLFANHSCGFNQCHHSIRNLVTMVVQSCINMSMCFNHQFMLYDFLLLRNFSVARWPVFSNLIRVTPFPTLCNALHSNVYMREAFSEIKNGGHIFQYFFPCISVSWFNSFDILNTGKFLSLSSVYMWYVY